MTMCFIGIHTRTVVRIAPPHKFTAKSAWQKTGAALLGVICMHMMFAAILYSNQMCIMECQINKSMRDRIMHDRNSDSDVEVNVCDHVRMQRNSCGTP
jgi:hypothetical protein